MNKAHSPENKLPVDYSDQHKYGRQRNPRYGGAIPNYLYLRQTCLQKREEQIPNEHHNNPYTQIDKLIATIKGDDLSTQQRIIRHSFLSNQCGNRSTISARSFSFVPTGIACNTRSVTSSVRIRKLTNKSGLGSSLLKESATKPSRK